MTDSITLRSAIIPGLLKRTLWMGSFLAFLGAAILVIAGAFTPLEFLDRYGLLIVLFSLCLIAYGLIPYRRLVALQAKPHTLILTNEGVFFSYFGKKTMCVPAESIAHVRFISEPTQYGLGLDLKEPLPKKIALFENFDAKRFQARSKRLKGCDLFFPFFSQRSFEQFNDFLN